jgi:hypothetical protein
MAFLIVISCLVTCIVLARRNMNTIRTNKLLSWATLK